MKIDGISYRSIWRDGETGKVSIIDQTKLPFAFTTMTLDRMLDARDAIRDMQVRGAPLIGAVGAFGLALAMQDDPSDENLDVASAALFEARPTGNNLGWALNRVRNEIEALPPGERADKALAVAADICEEDVAICSAIGDHGLPLIEEIARKKPGQTIDILTHCNAGWLATVDWGTALAPIYKAHDAGLDLHVWVGETRPRNQGTFITAYELGQHGVPHTVIVDSAGGHLMQHGMVDICFVGTDRTTRSGDVCNKIGTYLKALAARDNDVPFYVCAPSPSIDFSIDDGLKEIPIELRSAREISHLSGCLESGELAEIAILPDGSPGRNDAFDVTPAALVTGLVTERGVTDANRDAISTLFPEN
jgi:methylthioribose-1-phosphate isomerase